MHIHIYILGIVIFLSACGDVALEPTASSSEDAAEVSSEINSSSSDKNTNSSESSEVQSVESSTNGESSSSTESSEATSSTVSSSNEIDTNNDYAIFLDNIDGEDSDYSINHSWNYPFDESSLPEAKLSDESSEGTHSIELTFDSGIASGFFWGYDTPADLSDYANGYLIFDVKTESALRIGIETTQDLKGSIKLAEYTDLNDTWNEVVIPLSEFSEVSFNKVTVPINIIADNGGSLIIDNIRYSTTGTSTYREVTTSSDAGSGGSFAPATGDEFTIVIIPDTQYMMMDFSHKGSDYGQFTAQVNWIVAQKDNLNIQFIAHVGDVVDHVDKPFEWSQFKTGWSKVEDAGIPWAIAPGNHDTNLPMGEGNWDIYNSNYDATSFLASEWGDETFPEGRNENNVSFFSASGMDFMVLSIGYSMNGSEYAWASNVLSENPNKRAIINTHDVKNGNFADLAKENPNVFLIVSGHYCDGEWRNTITNDAGGTAEEIMSDYQCYMNGYLRYYTFKPADNAIEAVSYSPFENLFRTGSTSNFEWDYTMD